MVAPRSSPQILLVCRGRGSISCTFRGIEGFPNRGTDGILCHPKFWNTGNPISSGPAVKTVKISKETIAFGDFRTVAGHSD